MLIKRSIPQVRFYSTTPSKVHAAFVTQADYAAGFSTMEGAKMMVNNWCVYIINNIYIYIIYIIILVDQI